MVDSEVLTKLTCMISKLNTAYADMGELLREIDRRVDIVVKQHDEELADHRYRIKCLEEDVGNIKKVVGL